MDNFFWSNKKESDTKNKVGDELSEWNILDENKVDLNKSIDLNNTIPKNIVELLNFRLNTISSKIDTIIDKINTLEENMIKIEQSQAQNTSLNENIVYNNIDIDKILKDSSYKNSLDEIDKEQTNIDISRFYSSNLNRVQSPQVFNVNSSCNSFKMMPKISYLGLNNFSFNTNLNNSNLNDNSEYKNENENNFDKNVDDTVN